MNAEAAPVETRTASTNPILRGLLGLLLLLPACALCSANLLGPTIATFLASMNSFTLSGIGEFVGMDNFERLLEHQGFAYSLGFTMQLVPVRVLTAAVFPLLLTAGVYQFGKKLRLGVRLLFTLPMALFAPALIALASSRMSWMWNRESPESTVLLTEAVATMIVTCAAGLLVYSAILRRHADAEIGWKPAIPALIAAWLIGQFAVTAYALQSFPPLAQVAGAGNSSLAQFIYRGVLLFFDFGLGLAVSAIVFIVVAGFGVVATLTAILFRLQLEYDSTVENTDRPGNRALGILGWVVILLGAVGVILTLFVPYLISLLGATSWVGEGSTRSLSLVQIWLNSTLPPLLVVLFIQLPVAYLGALGIGAVRPLGRRSEWLLLLFAPWLFATSMPLISQRLIALSETDALDSFLALVPTLLISVPMLMVLTLFFKGMEPRVRQARAEGMPTMRAVFTRLIVPSLPLAGFLAALSFLAATQDFLTSLMVAAQPEQFTAAGTILRFADGPNALGAQTIVAIYGLPIFLIFSVIFIALRILYLDKLLLGREPTVAKQETPE
jgi:ABC-type sugar transport system permease subunit